MILTSLDNATGLWSFNYKIDGMIFLESPAFVLVLQRKTGQKTRVPYSDIKELLKPKDFDRVNSALLMTNYYQGPDYEIIGVN